MYFSYLVYCKYSKNSVKAVRKLLYDENICTYERSNRKMEKTVKLGAS